MRVGVGAAIVCATLYLACGGVNMSEKKNPPRSAATSDDDDDDDFDDDDDAGTGGGSGGEDAGPTPTNATDAGTSPEAGMSAPVPEGSFAAGTELETTANLNLRDGPGTSFAILTTMPAATRVKVETTSGADGWVHLDYLGTLGYASKSFLLKP
jgi:uncharacterized protein YgiM (DUF1202 family)